MNDNLMQINVIDSNKSKEINVSRVDNYMEALRLARVFFIKYLLPQRMIRSFHSFDILDEILRMEQLSVAASLYKRALQLIPNCSDKKDWLYASLGVAITTALKEGLLSAQHLDSVLNISQEKKELRKQKKVQRSVQRTMKMFEGQIAACLDRNNGTEIETICQWIIASNQQPSAIDLECEAYVAKIILFTEKRLGVGRADTYYKTIDDFLAELLRVNDERKGTHAYSGETRIIPLLFLQKIPMRPNGKGLGIQGMLENNETRNLIGYLVEGMSIWQLGTACAWLINAGVSGKRAEMIKESAAKYCIDAISLTLCNRTGLVDACEFASDPIFEAWLSDTLQIDKAIIYKLARKSSNIYPPSIDEIVSLGEMISIGGQVHDSNARPYLDTVMVRSAWESMLSIVVFSNIGSGNARKNATQLLTKLQKLKVGLNQSVISKHEDSIVATYLMAMMELPTNGSGIEKKLGNCCEVLPHTASNDLVDTVIGLAEDAYSAQNRYVYVFAHLWLSHIFTFSRGVNISNDTALRLFFDEYDGMSVDIDISTGVGGTGTNYFLPCKPSVCLTNVQHKLLLNARFVHSAQLTNELTEPSLDMYLYAAEKIVRERGRIIPPIMLALLIDQIIDNAEALTDIDKLTSALKTCMALINRVYKQLGDRRTVELWTRLYKLGKRCRNKVIIACAENALLQITSERVSTGTDAASLESNAYSDICDDRITAILTNKTKDTVENACALFSQNKDMPYIHNVAWLALLLCSKIYTCSDLAYLRYIALHYDELINDFGENRAAAEAVLALNTSKGQIRYAIFMRDYSKIFNNIPMVISPFTKYVEKLGDKVRTDALILFILRHLPYVNAQNGKVYGALVLLSTGVQLDREGKYTTLETVKQIYELRQKDGFAFPPLVRWIQKAEQLLKEEDENAKKS